MKRRDFSLACGSALAAGALISPAVQAQGKKPEAGTDYRLLDPRAPVDAPAGKIEVIEFFWYNCPHCSVFEPTFNDWLKRAPKDVAVKRVPVAFRADFAPQQRLFYALEAMGLVEKLHAKVFHAIHTERQALNRPDIIADWIAKQGVDRTQFLEQYNSFAAATKASRATQLQNAYRVEGVPALGVAGRFYVDGDLAKSMGRALQVVDFLVGEVRGGR